MKNLAIPLGKSQTTRRRRVVSWRIALSLACLSAATLAADAWFSRDMLSAAAPEGTAAMVRFTPTRGTWDDLDALLDGIPLISNRPATIRDIRFVRGEFALFIGDDGHRSLGVRARREDLPQALFDAYGITVQEVSPASFLLSDRLESVSGLHAGRSLVLPPLPWSEMRRLGTVRLPDAPIGTLYASAQRIEVRFPSMDLPTTTLRPSDGMVGYIATPLLPNTGIEWMKPPFTSMVTPLQGPDIPMISRWTSGPGVVALRQDGGYLLAVEGDSFGPLAPKDLIRTIAALRTPILTPWVLQDGTRTRELRADPSQAAIETAVVAGHEVFSTPIGPQESLFATKTPERVILTNARDLLESMTSPMEDGADDPCTGNVSYLHLPSMLLSTPPSYDAPYPSITSELARLFPNISVNNSWMQTKIILCR